MTAPEEPPFDLRALRRRVLLAGLASLVAFTVVAYLLSAVRAPDVVLLPAVALAYLLVARPLMAPVREAVRTRRALAYQAYLAAREGTDPP